MAKLLCVFVLAGLIFQVSALDWHPTHWIPNPLKWVPNPFKWISDHTGWISKLNPLHWFGNKCNPPAKCHGAVLESYSHYYK
ncbi:hypothetical protein TNIN_29961 [Trichonephila inaurata madagascariensis]|uniref:Uncharacterized protein n=1 Tax=Trichonephila inaurata madagascariensis TaxID=2747483 RepID=A0A8X7CL55_9ARAC|nr:hypothetical protein TNIN_29961 [Trichonephila inaurata madagascariensis]